ncbi:MULTISPECIES: alpha/beta hydrolase [Kitasatospora]|uniref:AB hydrolase-1 domain-containing protein n=1 Tax=Kitasatospora setae (strain ATCC 33774 / DSM 43861 / JCM 3304 / KCC A-0304 / NBRC 14216 / KM-6054) TaxID=452652 RepID=E4N346_KITSK|nr:MULTISPECIES: alpha/beta hydrolase [Kitasatospora]BAJ32580.1 hypothetical protein KSE_68220 [Kitasatospora setae KM-6054]
MPHAAAEPQQEGQREEFRARVPGGTLHAVDLVRLNAEAAALADHYRASPGFLLGLPYEPLEPERPGIAHLDRIDTPALVLVGEHDAPYGHGCFRRLAAGLPRARAEVVPGADHLVNLTRPEEFARRLAAFLATLPGR